MQIVSLLDTCDATRRDLDRFAGVVHGSLIEGEIIEVEVFGIPTGLILTQSPRRSADIIVEQFETRLRRHVVNTMRKKYGDSWLDDKFPDLKQKWLTRRREAVSSGDLVDYAYPLELMRIIEGFWDQAFAGNRYKLKAIRNRVMQINDIRNEVAHYRKLGVEQVVLVTHAAKVIERWFSYR